LNTPSADWTWDEMLSAFRALGGTADNIRLGQGPLGRGLFPIDPARPIRLRLPENLLFPIDDIELVGERIRMRDRARIKEPEREFFEGYENAFSWGGGGRSESADFVASLDALPEEVRALLITEFAMGELFEGDPVERGLKKFLRSRLIEWKGRDVAMPLIELANHDASGLPYQLAGAHLQIEGPASDEVLACYGGQDSLGIFMGFGFACPQPGAFSLPQNMTIGARELRIERDASRRVRRGDVWTPQLNSKGKKLELSFLMIGNPIFPKLSRGTFCALMRQAGVEPADEAFDLILHVNARKFLQLLEVLEPHHGDLILTLRKMARYQLEAMAHCIGTREL
jgi:hypothetical protein